MGDELEEETILSRVEELWELAEKLIVSRERPCFARKFTFHGGLVIVDLGVALEGDAITLEDDLHGCEDVVEETVLREIAIEPPADSVEGTGGADDGVNLTFGVADPLFVGPIGSRALRRVDLKLPTDGADLWVGKPRDEVPKRASINALACVAEEEKLPLSLSDAAVKAGSFALGRIAPSEVHAAV